MAYRSLFNELYDPIIADIFLRELDSRDLSIFMTLTAIYADKPLYDWLFLRVLSKNFNIRSDKFEELDEVDYKHYDPVKIPHGFKELRARNPNTDCVAIDNILTVGMIATSIYEKYYNRTNLTILGASLYAHRTGWLILYSGTAREYPNALIDYALYCGYNIAIDPMIKIVKSGVWGSSTLIYKIFPDDYHIDERMTSFLCVPNLVAYTNNRSGYEWSFLYLQSIDPTTIRNAVDAVNNKVLMSSIDARYIVIRDPWDDSKYRRLQPHIIYGSSNDPPAIISLPSVTRDILSRDDPLFRELPRLQE